MGALFGRYHAASLAAVFLALAVGILIGVGLGDDLVAGTGDDLSRAWRATSRTPGARPTSCRWRWIANELSPTRAYPALVGDRLQGARSG